MDNANWIMCGERSPEEEDIVLLTFKNDAGLHVDTAIYRNNAYFYIVETEDICHEFQYSIPVAWMKMPKPFSFDNDWVR